jgi:hypothetical protein
MIYGSIVYMDLTLMGQEPLHRLGDSRRILELHSAGGRSMNIRKRRRPEFNERNKKNLNVVYFNYKAGV